MQIGVQLVTLMEQFHSIGCVYNDLKLDNICVGTSNLMDPKTELKLIDFGLTTSYVKLQSIYKEPVHSDHHIDKSLQDFQGNFAFCSPNSINGTSTSRRDDMFSILYLLLYLFTNKIPFFDSKLPQNQLKIKYKQKKLTYTGEAICTEMRCPVLIDFAKEVYEI